MSASHPWRPDLHVADHELRDEATTTDGEHWSLSESLTAPVSGKEVREEIEPMYRITGESYYRTRQLSVPVFAETPDGTIAKVGEKAVAERTPAVTDGKVYAQPEPSWEDDEARWCNRDVREFEREHKARGEGEMTNVIGANAAGGANGSRQWLDHALAQLRIDYRLVLPGCRAHWQKRSHLPRSFAGDWRNDPQLKSLERRAQAMRHRFNVRRHLEALDLSPDGELPPFLVHAPAWDARGNPILTPDGKQVLRPATWREREVRCEELHAKLSEDALMGRVENYVAPTGLIAA